MNFNASVFMTEQMNNLMVKAGKELAERAVIACAEHYKFDAEEAIRLLSLENVKVERKESGKSKSKSVVVKKVAAVKAAFPMPFNGEFKDTCCYALRQNNGLYTQCQVVRKGDNSFCKQCQVLADKGVDGIPEYGTIQQRMASGIFEYVDPKGRKPVSYTKVMKKYKLTQTQVEEEATKLNINMDEAHFVSPEADTKRGRPSSQKEKAPKEEKQAKGRPKKEKKVIQIEGDDEDLFAALVADANSAVEETEPKVQKKKGQTEEEKAEKAAKLAAEKAEKAAKLAAEKQEKEAKLAAAKAEKEAKLAAEKAEKEAKLAAEKAEKEAKLAAAKAEKEAKLAAAKAEKEAKLAAAEQKKALAEQKKESSEKKKKATKEEASDEEPEVVKKIEFEGKKYLKSKKTNIIYDYIEYTKNQEQIVVGHWNDSTNKIEFVNTDEESEDEYEA